jgi:hypothetical protein
VSPLYRVVVPCWLLAIARAALGAGEATPESANPAPTPDAAVPSGTAAQPSWLPSYELHAQTTVIMYRHTSFDAPYSGPNSLQSDEGTKTSMTGTLFFGMPLWRGGEAYVDPEIAGGEGPSQSLGVAGAINGETPRVTDPKPTPYLARWFLRQVIPIGGATLQLDSAPHQIATSVTEDRVVLTVGKLAANDVFDDNTYSHDPRSQFSNWALWENGAWDYPADTRGYTLGGAGELYLHAWVLRLGIFQEPKVANGLELEHDLRKAAAYTGELERDYALQGRKGAIRVLAFANRSHAGSYEEALALGQAHGTTPDITQTRSSRTKYGFGLNAEQDLGGGLGAFSRVGWNDGHSESWAFTEIDRTVSLGLNLRGDAWGRPADTAAIAGAVNGISQPHREYLAAGGLGFMLGDGALTYRPERIIEAYYLLRASPNIAISPSVQYVANPGYNHDRGPVWFGGLRAHLDI